MTALRASASVMAEQNKTRRVYFHTDDFDVYIGRAGRGWQGTFGNPFRLKPGEPRGATIQRFREHFYRRIAEDPAWRQRVLALKGKRLACPGCPPGLPCHGDVYVEFLEGHE